MRSGCTGVPFVPVALVVVGDAEDVPSAATEVEKCLEGTRTGGRCPGGVTPLADDAGGVPGVGAPGCAALERKRDCDWLEK